MVSSFKNIFKTIVLILSWIIFSPLFLFLSIKWRVPKLVPRIILTTLAPLSLLIIFFVSRGTYDYYYYNIKRGSKSEIEAKTGLDFPKFKTIEKRHTRFGPAFNGDFSMEYTVKFDTLNIAIFYQQIENKIESGSTNLKDSVFVYWDRYGDGIYSFNFNDLEENLELIIDSNKEEMRITYGCM
ncbi:hypothetical protein INQ51_17095 [Maribellus sp. CM-23]|uniref:hypothetical protein n=1 Tax=Maribellus sp. CM-23 TaxID=2781026 RepID=UPI001F289356|nr:hypothetical protein [Maribellus sp. CM-23]MCE4566039.1 hypothetical protein [Maribellus sp. CM-23]